MPQQVLNLQDVLASQANWDAALQANISALRAALRTFQMSIASQGSVSGASTINIQLENADGSPLAEQVFLRVRICNNGGYAVATNASFTVSTGTVVETKTAGKDLIIQSNASGLIVLSVTDATAETMTIRLAPADIQPAFANHNNSQQLTHA